MSAKRNGERGQGLVEFAVIFPIFVLLLFIVIDGGILMGRYSEVNHAAHEGARLAATGESGAQVMAQVAAGGGLLAGASGCGAAAKQVCLQWSDGPNGEAAGQVGSWVKVVVKYRYGLITPLAARIGGGGFNITSCAVMRLERPLATDPGASGSSTC